MIVERKMFCSMGAKLSIAIPTYGAPKGVIQNVQRLLRYEDDRIEIIVIDNDETGEQIKDKMLQIKDPRFYYFQNKTNIGRSNNVAKAVELASMDHVLLLSSNDQLYFDAVNEILEKLDKYPNYGIMLGTVTTNTGGYGFDPKSPGIYKAGYEALITIPFLGNLMPMVINRKYLDFKYLYGQNEHYMQLRMALIAAKYGDLIYLNNTIGDMSANENNILNKETDECFFNGYTPEKWDISIGGHLHYSPEARILQLKSYLTLIEDCCERRDQKSKVIEKWVISLMAKCLYAIAHYVSPYSIRVDGQMGHLHYKDVLDLFKNEMLSFFKEREDKGSYYFSGHLQDLVNNELLLIAQGKSILESILSSDRVYIWGTGRNQINLQSLLKCMKIQSYLSECKEDLTDALVLVLTGTNNNLRKEMLDHGAAQVLFMDRMAKYIGIVWCSEHDGPEYWDEYVAYMD